MDGVFFSWVINDKAPFVASSTNVTGGVIYQTARISPTSLRYYALCMRNGSYKVRLHFAEIMFSDDVSFMSLGRRYFDVAVQGVWQLTNFNIWDEAGGAGKGMYKDFDNVIVNGSTIEIQLYWAGKGTTAIPDRGVHGPLLSAIEITPNFDVGEGLPARALAGIGTCSLALIVVVIALVWWRRYIRDKRYAELREIELRQGYYSLRQLKAATNNFDSANKIGEGGFGSVYRGKLSDGTEIAVKQLSAKSKQGNREFVTEVGLISALQHPNLVKFYGHCIEGEEMLLVYEYLANNSLSRALFGHEGQKIHLNWSKRRNICMGIARGLTYLHEESTFKVIHRDIKAPNVLLDAHLNAKISDFGLAKLFDDAENTHIDNTRVAGTRGYMAPEYATRGWLSAKADVFSFGVVTLEIVSGKSNSSFHISEDDRVYLLDWAYILQEQGNLLEIVDPSLNNNYSKDEALRMIKIVLLCTSQSPSFRPLMSSVVKMLEGKIPIELPKVKGDAPHSPVDIVSKGKEILEVSIDATSLYEDESSFYEDKSSFYVDKFPASCSKTTCITNEDMSIFES